jgi:hypothetical protein
MSGKLHKPTFTLGSDPSLIGILGLTPEGQKGMLYTQARPFNKNIYLQTRIICNKQARFFLPIRWVGHRPCRLVRGKQKSDSDDLDPTLDPVTE